MGQTNAVPGIGQPSPPIGLPPSRLISPNRRDPLFAQYPIMREVRLRSGIEVAVPFQCFDADMLVIYGTARTSAVQAWTSGTGYVPVSIGDPSATVISLWIMDYADSVIGSYRELVIAASVCRAGRHYSHVSPYSLLVPALDPENALFVHKLELDQAVAIDYGREILGLDKTRAQVDIRREGCSKKFEVVAADDRKTVTGEIRERDGFRTRLGMLLGLGGALGWGKALRAALTPVSRSAAVSVDVMADPQRREVKASAFIVKAAPILNVLTAEDRIDLGDSGLGQALRDAGFRPQLSQRHPHAKFVVQPL